MNPSDTDAETASTTEGAAAPELVLVPLADHPLSLRRQVNKGAAPALRLGDAIAEAAPDGFNPAKGWTAFLAAQKARHRVAREGGGAEAEAAEPAAPEGADATEGAEAVSSVPTSLRKRGPLDRLLNEVIDLAEVPPEVLTQLGADLRFVARRHAPADEATAAAARLEAGLLGLVKPTDHGPYALTVTGWPPGLTEEQQRQLVGRRPEALGALTAREAADLADRLGSMRLGGTPLDIRLSLPRAGHRFPVPAKKPPVLKRNRPGSWLKHTDEVGRFSLTAEPIAREQAALVEAALVMDAFGGLGGNTVAFAEAGKQVIVFEANTTRRALLGQNLWDRGLRDGVSLGEGTVPDGLLAALSEHPEAAVFLDPPWGGAERGQQATTLAELLPGSEAWLPAVMAQPEVVFKLPAHFDVSTLPGFPEGWTLHWHLGDPAMGAGHLVKVLSARFRRSS